MFFLQETELVAAAVEGGFEGGEDDGVEGCNGLVVGWRWVWWEDELLAGGGCDATSGFH